MFSHRMSASFVLLLGPSPLTTEVLVTPSFSTCALRTGWANCVRKLPYHVTTAEERKAYMLGPGKRTSTFVSTSVRFCWMILNDVYCWGGQMVSRHHQHLIPQSLVLIPRLQSRLLLWIRTWMRHWETIERGESKLLSTSLRNKIERMLKSFCQAFSDNQNGREQGKVTFIQTLAV